ncbi:ghrelin-like [Pyxicephalus adspersus]|uniref:ghrelin-like n=1 Tax=Pyxicephalus adspersus TaxID=30357 RepID=UPI003B5AA14F
MLGNLCSSNDNSRMPFLLSRINMKQTSEDGHFTAETSPTDHTVTSDFRMKLGKVAIFGAVLFCLLWTEETQAGLTFLSPVDMQKIAGRQSQNKLRPGGMNRRETEDDLDEEQKGIGVTIPLDMSMKMTQEQLEKQKAAVQDFLYSFLSLRSLLEGKNENTWSQ